jgi:Uma2 family endonuclease
MTAAAADPPRSRDEDLLSVWAKLDLPPGWRAEIIFDGTITVTPPPLPPHSWIDSLLTRTIIPRLPAGLGVAHELDVFLPPIDKLYRPDLVVLPDSVLDADISSAWIESGDILLVVEITSKKTANIDRTDKRKGYARSGVPLYLLVDRWSRPAEVTLLSEPSGEDYQQAVGVPFGESIMLPEPFNVEIDTSRFRPGRKS